MPSPTDNQLKQEPNKRQSKALVFTLNSLILLLALLAGYFSHALVSHSTAEQVKQPDPSPATQPRIVQLDIVNRCSIRNAGTKTTDYLRSRGFDVVAVKSPRSPHVSKTLVIDRVGNLEAARRVAVALGVADTEIVQQLNPDYFVDVSVVLGDDYNSLLQTN